MSQLPRPLTVILCVVLTAGTVSAQPAREFGWSLEVEPAERKRAEARPMPKPFEAASLGEIRVDTDLVLSDLLVQDKNGSPVSGLKASDFEISEDGSPQKIDVFAYGDASIPRSIILVIDHSLSQWRQIDRSVGAAKVLVDSLRAADRMAIVSDDVVLIAEFTSDKALLKSALDGLRIKCTDGKFGKSRQYSALFAALNERISRNGTRNIVIFQTDGDEFGTLRRSRSPGVSNFGVDDIVRAAERKGATIYSVFTGSQLAGRSKRERFEQTRREIDDQIQAYALVGRSKTPRLPVKLSDEYVKARVHLAILEEEAVRTVAEESGGISQTLESPDQAAVVYERILGDIERRYLIGYYPTDRPNATLREKEVRITLKNRGNYRIVGGRTYVAY
ncbi:MAG: VWA domain-containing protein [Pyrinomonadaceae bacterium]